MDNIYGLVQGLIVPVFGENRKTRKLLEARLRDMDRMAETEDISSILREKYLKKLSPWEARIESLIV